MARIPVAELRVQTQGPGLVRVTATAPAVREGRDLRQWVQESGVTPRAMLTTGLGLLAAGIVGALVLSSGLVGVLVSSTMLTLGGGLAFLGILERKNRSARPQPALPSSSPAVLAERSRRVLALLDDGRDPTFEQLLGALRWTEAALLETLLAMKESGQVIEDLDLDSGEWVYRAQVTAFGTGGGMTLADRRGRAP